MENWVTPVLFEAGSIILAVIMFYAGVKRFGFTTTAIFFIGSIIWATAIENIGVLAGSYTYYGFSDLFIPGYPGFLLWVGFVPFAIQLG